MANSWPKDRYLPKRTSPYAPLRVGAYDSAMHVARRLPEIGCLQQFEGKQIQSEYEFCPLPSSPGINHQSLRSHLLSRSQQTYCQTQEIKAAPADHWG